ncbi:MAG: phenylalanyl-tRNA synthetase alpha chain [Actinomycetota bacterium]
MISEITAARIAAEQSIAAASTLDELRVLDTDLLGKKSPLALLKTGLGKLETVDEKKAAGQSLNEAMLAVEEVLNARRALLGRAERDWVVPNVMFNLLLKRSISLNISTHQVGVKPTS